MWRAVYGQQRNGSWDRVYTLVRLMAASGSLTARPIAHKMVNRPVDECAARRLGRMTGPRHSAESDKRILGLRFRCCAYGESETLQGT